VTPQHVLIIGISKKDKESKPQESREAMTNEKQQALKIVRNTNN
jgi:hypothetical protein